MTVRKRDKVLVILSCLHTALFPEPAPHVGERVYCFRCGAYRDAAEAPHNYVIKCGSCQYMRYCGNALITAEVAASRHALRRPGHRVSLVDGELPVRTFHHEPMPTNVDIPPF